MKYSRIRASLATCIDRNASRRSDIAYVAQSLRRLRFPGIIVATPSKAAYGHHDAIPRQIFLPHIFLPSVSLQFLRTTNDQNVGVRLQSKRRLRDRQRQNTNRILNHGGHGDHGENRDKYTISMNSGMQSYCPAIEPLVLRVLRTTNS